MAATLADASCQRCPNSTFELNLALYHVGHDVAKTLNSHVGLCQVGQHTAKMLNSRISDKSHDQTWLFTRAILAYVTHLANHIGLPL